MTGDIFNKILGGLAAVAPTVANLALPGSGALVDNLMRAVTGDQPDTPIEQVAAKIEADPKLMVQLQGMAMDHEIKLADIEAKKLESVNATMRQESKSEHWPQYSWRPWNGFWFAPVVACIYVLLPILGKTVPAVPQVVWIGWLAILGVATLGRNKEKVARAGGSTDGLLSNAIKAIRG